MMEEDAFEGSFQRLRDALVDMVRREDVDGLREALQRFTSGDTRVRGTWRIAADCALELQGQRRPLHVAAELGNVSIMRLLVQGGGHVDLMGGTERTPLYDAVLGGRQAAAEYLLENGAKPNHVQRLSEVALASETQKQHEYGTVLHVLAATKNEIGQDVAMARLLLAHGANPNARTDPRRETLLHRLPSVELAAVILAAGGDVRARNIRNQTALERAESELKMFEWLGREVPTTFGASDASPSVEPLVSYARALIELLRRSEEQVPPPS